LRSYCSNGHSLFSTLKPRLHQGKQHVAGNKIVASLLPICCWIQRDTNVVEIQATCCRQQATCCRATCCPGVNAALYWSLQWSIILIWFDLSPYVALQLHAMCVKMERSYHNWRSMQFVRWYEISSLISSNVYYCNFKTLLYSRLYKVHFWVH